MDIVVTSGAGRAPAAGPDSSPAATSPEVTAATQALRRGPDRLALQAFLGLLVLNPPNDSGS
ncbi:hypothetical protein GCM10009601_32880 [Streptomyces thermospinosisporus]|uniref:Uncharacterized protein n=1 Tax=Streptomyces thermospinosisporus TaxID=161482 RepID=A0ABP4JQV1_9ACTN